MSPDYDPRAQCGRGVGSAGLGLPPAHSLRQAPPSEPRTGGSAGAEGERDPKEEDLSQEEDRTLSSRLPSASWGPALPRPRRPHASAESDGSCAFVCFLLSNGSRLLLARSWESTKQLFSSQISARFPPEPLK